MAARSGGAYAAVPTIATMMMAGIMVVVMAGPIVAEESPVEPATITAPLRDGSPLVVTSSDSWATYIAEAARRFTIPERWIQAVMAVESAGDPAALSPRGAIGLMQIMPDTWDELRAKHGLDDDPWQPRDNILAGAAYLREMHDRYGSIDAMLAAYNAGPRRYDVHLASGRALPAETVDYVAKIMPMIDGTAAIARADGHPTRPSWSRAPLFIAPSAVHEDDDPMTADLPSGRPLDGQPIVDLSALVPPSDGLFVSRPAGSGEQR